jgi:hypothetical protein
MSSSQMGHIMPITYLLPTSHLQLTTYLPTYLPTNPPTYLNVLPIYQPTLIEILSHATIICNYFLVANNICN